MHIYVTQCPQQSSMKRCRQNFEILSSGKWNLAVGMRYTETSFSFKNDRWASAVGIYIHTKEGWGSTGLF